MLAKYVFFLLIKYLIRYRNRWTSNSVFRLCNVLSYTPSSVISVNISIVCNRPYPIYCWLNAKVDCTYQSLVFNVILIDYALIRFDKLMEEGNIEELSLSQNCFDLPRTCVIKIESEALVSTSDFCPVLTKWTVSWGRSVPIYCKI